MSRGWTLIPAAEESLTDVFLWTTERFGPRQARAYGADLLAAFDRIAAGTLRGRSCRREWGDGIPAGQLFAKVRSHVAIWEETPEEVVVVDVMHGAMDLARRVRR